MILIHVVSRVCVVGWGGSHFIPNMFSVVSFAPYTSMEIMWNADFYRTSVKEMKSGKNVGGQQSRALQGWGISNMILGDIPVSLAQQISPCGTELSPTLSWEPHVPSKSVPRGQGTPSLSKFWGHAEEGQIPLYKQSSNCRILDTTHIQTDKIKRKGKGKERDAGGTVV